MNKAEDTVSVFTVRSPQRILREGGSQAWVLNPVRAKQCTWIVCVQNRQHVDHVFEVGTAPHSTAFMLARIAGMRRSEEASKVPRWLVTFEEYAMIDLPDVWQGWRNPVRYTRLAALGLDPERLSFQLLVPTPETTPVQPVLPAAAPATKGLTIADAKRGLASTFGLGEEAIEITIRG